MLDMDTLSPREAMIYGIGLRRSILVDCNELRRISLTRETHNLELFVWIFDSIPGMWRHLGKIYTPRDLVEKVARLAEGQAFDYKRKS